MSAGWDTFAVAVPGDRHLRTARPCEDAHRWAALAGGGIVAVVADGVSSAPRAATGAALAAEAALALVTRSAGALPGDGAAWRGYLADVVRRTRERVQLALQATDPDAEPGAGRGTIGICVIAPPWVAFAAVGDVFLVVRRSDGSWHVACGPRSDPTAVNRTATLLDRPAPAPDIRVICDPFVDGALVCSDGLAPIVLEDPAQAGERTNRRFVEPIARHVAEGEDPNVIASLLLSRKDVRSRTDDDRTLLLAVRRSC